MQRGSIMMDYGNFWQTNKEWGEKKGWIDLINESVHTSDEVDIGDVDAVSRDFIVVKRGFVNVHYYYIPIGKVEGWDGHVLWLKIPEIYIKNNYERDVHPEPSRYYVKDFPGYTAIYPTVDVILPRYTQDQYTPQKIPRRKIFA